MNISAVLAMYMAKDWQTPLNMHWNVVATWAALSSQLATPQRTSFSCKQHVEEARSNCRALASHWFLRISLSNCASRCCYVQMIDVGIGIWHIISFRMAVRRRSHD